MRMGCPDDTLLLAMAERSLAPDQFALIEVHMDSCEHCRKLVAAAVGVKRATFDADTALAAGTPAPRDGRASLLDISINDRYLIETLLGRGGMGSVYLALDRTLDRQVALKLHRAGSGSERLHREAMAMAKLAHPNVVTVFEIATVDDRLYVAMEYVRGTTLREWLATGRRSWRQIIAMLLETGSGLAAAHAAGLIHRDFKPENVLVGDDRRPRVGDFGLARVDSTPSGERRSLPSGDDTSDDDSDAGRSIGMTPLDTPMTETGALLGTPAYMAPEQLAGDSVDARCDQFAFCVVAWECLYGKRPFVGRTLVELQQAIEAHQLPRHPRSDVPARVRRVLERGLSLAPADRFSDMPSLLAALRTASAPRTRRRLAWAIAGAALLGGAGIAAASLVGERRHEAACAADVAEMHDVFDPLTRVQARVAFVATGTPGAGAAFTRTEKVLLRYADALGRQASVVCRGLVEPPAVTAARKACLAERKQELASFVTMLRAPDRAIVNRATNAAWSLFDASPCNDPQTLLARAATSSRTPPEVAAQLRELKALDDLGRYDEGIARAEPILAAARARGDKHAELSALLALGNLYADVENVEQTLATFDQAIALAETLGRDLDAAAGHAALANHHGVVTNDYAAAHRSIGLARAKLERLGSENPAVRGELLMIEAQVFADENRLGDAEKSMRAAAETIESAYGPEHPKLGAALGTLSQILRYQRKVDESLAAAERALATLSAAYGSDHPYVAGAEMTVGQNLADLGRHGEARERYRRADAIFARVFGDVHPYRAAIAANIGSVDLHEKDFAAAEASFRRAHAMIVQLKGDGHMDALAARGDIARAMAMGGRVAEALAEQERVVAGYQALGRDGEPRLVGGLLDLVHYQLDGGNPQLAMATAERALGLAEKRGEDANPGEIAEAKFLLSRALWAVGHDRGRARRLAAQARTATASLSPALATELETWLTQLDAAPK
jgi:eukaryotic-like serine/threonine-protein kinase